MSQPETATNGRLAGEVQRYLIASALSFFMSLALPVVFRELFALPVNIAVALSFMLVFVLNFFIVRWFVFRSVGAVAGQLARFSVVSALMRIAEYGAFVLLYELSHMHYLPALVTVLLFSFVLKFILQRTMVFRA